MYITNIREQPQKGGARVSELRRRDGKEKNLQTGAGESDRLHAYNAFLKAEWQVGYHADRMHQNQERD